MSRPMSETLDAPVEAPGVDGIAVENPATGETLATVPELGAAEVAAMAEKARAAQPGWWEAGFDARAEVLLAARAWLVAERRAGRRHDLRRDGPPGRRDAVRRVRLRPLGARVLGEERARLSGRRGDRVGVALRPRQAPGRPLRAGRARRRHRALELPAQQLVRRLHPGARGRQRGDPQAVRADAADLAPDGADARRVRPARRRLPGRDRPRRDGRGASRRGGLRDVHRLGQDRQAGDGSGGRDAHARRARARRQGPDDRPEPMPTSSAPQTPRSATG